MTNLLIASGLLLLALAGVVMRKTYFYLPLSELKRQAESGDELSKQLYRAAAYSNSLKALLWLYIGLTSAGAIIVLARNLPVWVSLLIVGPILWTVFSLIPSTRLTKIGIGLTSLFTPPIAWILNYVHPIFSRTADVVDIRYIKSEHTRIYEREDLIELIDRQQQQSDNRLTEEELEIMKRALGFSDHQVADIMTSRKKIKIIKSDDSIGPVLIDELHKAGQAYALVRDDKKGPFIGSLAYSKLNLESSGHVKDLMNKSVYYLHEKDSLSEALHAFFVTNYPVFIVINDFEEYVGTISIEQVIKELLGHIPGDDFALYGNMEAVVARHQKPETIEPKETEPDKTPDEVVE